MALRVWVSVGSAGGISRQFVQKVIQQPEVERLVEEEIGAHFETGAPVAGAYAGEDNHGQRSRLARPKAFQQLHPTTAWQLDVENEDIGPQLPQCLPASPDVARPTRQSKALDFRNESVKRLTDFRTILNDQYVLAFLAHPSQ
jgi:hypothetical protein